MRLTIEIDMDSSDASGMIKVYMDSDGGDDYAYADLLSPKLRKAAKLLDAIRKVVKEQVT